MTFKIKQEYFENNIDDEDSNFVLADGFYSRTIQQDELILAFDETEDGQFHRRSIIGCFFFFKFNYILVITLSYTQATNGSNVIALSETESIR